MDLTEFIRNFGTEKKCIHFLKKQRERQGVTCPHCQRNVTNWKPRHRYWRYSCGRKISLKSGTLMESSKLPFALWFKAIYLMTDVKKSYSILELSRLLGVKRYRTVWYLSMKLRMAMGNNLLAKEYFLYFTLISKDKSAYCGLKAIQNYSITAISRGGSHKTDEINLIAPIRLLKKVSAEEKRLSAKGYRCLKLFNTHKKIELKKSYYPVKTHEKNWLNYLMANENRILNGTHHGVSYLHLQKYMFEYSFNYNLRFCNKFKILVESILT